MGVDRAKGQAGRALREASPWLERLGRCGYAAKGLVYALIGVLAVQVAAGVGGATTDAQGALRQIFAAPFGRVLLAAIAIGLLGFALWQVVQAALDTERKGADARGLATRAAYAANGAIHVGLALSALRLLRGGASGDGDTAAQGWTARLLGWPGGALLVGLVGAGVIGFGAYQLYRAYRATFREALELGGLGADEARWVVRLGRLGHAAQGVVFGIIGAFLLVAAKGAAPGEARGLGGALAALAQQAHGQALLGLVAAGLVAHGLYLLAEARYRRMVVR